MYLVQHLSTETGKCIHSLSWIWSLRRECLQWVCVGKDGWSLSLCSQGSLTTLPPQAVHINQKSLHFRFLLSAMTIPPFLCELHFFLKISITNLPSSPKHSHTFLNKLPQPKLTYIQIYMKKLSSYISHQIDFFLTSLFSVGHHWSGYYSHIPTVFAYTDAYPSSVQCNAIIWNYPERFKGLLPLYTLEKKFNICPQ